MAGMDAFEGELCSAGKIRRPRHKERRVESTMVVNMLAGSPLSTELYQK